MDAVVFVSDVGRPGYCTRAYCNHGEFEHTVDGECRTCRREWKDGRRKEIRVCHRYDPPLYFVD